MDGWNWTRPHRNASAVHLDSAVRVRSSTARAGLKCEVAVVQLPNGDVVDVRTVTCNGDDAVQRSIENAVRRASPLPLPENRMLFERNIPFIFEPVS